MEKIAFIYSDESSGSFMFECMEVLGLDPSEVCPIFVEGASKKEYATQKAIVTQILVNTEINTLVLMGETACNVFNIKTKQGAKDTTGRMQNLEVNGKKFYVMPTYNLANVDKVRSKLPRFIDHLNKARNIAFDIVESDSSTKLVFCDTLDKVIELVQYIWITKMCSFDFESTTLDKDLVTFDPNFKPTMLSISFQIGSSYVIPLHHKDTPFSVEEIAHIFDILRPIFESPEIRKLAHNFNFEAHVLRRLGITDLRGRLDDTMLMHHLIDELGEQGLKPLVDIYLPEFSGYEDEIKGIKWEDIPLMTLARYNSVDSDVTLRLCVLFESYLLNDNRLYTIYRNLSMAAFRALWQAEADGMLIDREFLLKAVEELKAVIVKKELELRNHKTVRRFEAYHRQQANNAELQKLESKLAELVEAKNAKLDKEIENRAAKLASWKFDNAEKPKYQEMLSKKLSEFQDWKSKQGLPSKTETTLREKIKSLKTGTISAYEPFNFGSPKQISDLLYESKAGFMFPTQKGGTGKDLLLELEDESGFVEGLLSLRSLEKTLATYLEGILKRLDSNDRIHTQFLIHGTVSGRLCVGEDTMIQTNVGLVRIGDICPENEGVLHQQSNESGNYMLALTHEGNYKQITHTIHKGYEEMFSVEVVDRACEIECTKGHRFLTAEGWKPLSELCVGDVITVYSVYDSFEPSIIASITPIGVKKVCDITVKDDHSYIGNGFVCHNSSRNPNLQNLPNIAKLKDLDVIHAIGLIKQCFKCPDGYVMEQADYSQAELRIIAEFANETAMLAVYEKDEDIHTTGAAAMMRLALEQFFKLDPKVQKSARTKAKARNFGLIYGMGAKGFMEYAKSNFGIVMTLDEAEREVAAFFEMFPRLKNYHREYEQKGKQYGWVRTLFGRKRQVPNINHDNDYIRSMDERICVNSPVQGTAGEFTIFAIALLRLRLDPRVKLANTVHDSIIFYIPKDIYFAQSAIIKHTMENLPTLQYFGKELKKVKMKADQEATLENWKNLKEKSTLIL